MSTSAQENRTVRNRYGAAALFCIVFAVIYERFSHGVISAWMVTTPAYMLFSMLLFHAFYRADCPVGEWFRVLWMCGMATLTVCSCLRGVFEIYGTDFPYFRFLLVAGIVCVANAVVAQARRVR